MKKALGLFLLIICCITLLTGCQPKVKLINSNPESQPTAKPTAQPYQYSAKAIYIKKSDKTLVAVLENGKVIEVQNPDNLNNVFSGCVTEKLRVSVDKNGNEIANLTYPYTYGTQIPVISDYDDAPGAFAQALLDNQLYNGTPAAISDYQLNSVEVRGRQNEGRIDVEMNFDVKPCRNSYLYGSPSSDGFVRDRTHSFTIYGTHNIWLSMRNERIYGINEKIDEQKPLSSKHMVLADNEELLYETETFTYYCRYTYLPQTETDKKNGISVEYITSIWSLNHQTGATIKLLDDKRNYHFSYADYVNNKLYLSSEIWEPCSEAHPGNILYIKEDAQNCIVIIDFGRIITTVEEMAYGVTGNQLFSIDLKTGTTADLCKLPYQDAESNPMSIRHVIDDIMTIAYYGEEPDIYEINLSSGEVKMATLTNDINQKISGGNETSISNENQSTISNPNSEHTSAYLTERKIIEILENAEVADKLTYPAMQHSEYNSLIIHNLDHQYALAGITQQFTLAPSFPRVVYWFLIDMKEEKVTPVKANCEHIVGYEQNIIAIFDEGRDYEAGLLDFPKIQKYNVKTTKLWKEPYFVSLSDPRIFELGHISIPKVKIKKLDIEDNLLSIEFAVTPETEYLGGGPIPRIRLYNGDCNTLIIDLYASANQETIVEQITLLENHPALKSITFKTFRDAQDLEHTALCLEFKNEDIHYSASLVESSNKIPELKIEFK